MKTILILLIIKLMIVLMAAFAGCYHNFQPTELSVEEARGKEITSPAKCHLIDVSIVVFERGFSVGANVLTGYGVKHALAGKDATAVVSTVARPRLSYRSFSWVLWGSSQKQTGKLEI